ncbi:MAG: septum formation protein Maf [Lachnospiraceae bacterium]|nr:septum formation protein Maf [Lachnospiraceae bacterium]MBP5298949.1 septum formation protein Maf [Lachnospiraceae bacterium]
MNKIILASGSPRRKELLGALYKDFAIIPAKGDEVTTRKIPSEIVSELAYGKAAEVYDRALELDEYFNSDFLVIGSDTVVAYKDEIMGKPKDEEDARRMLKDLSGDVHQVYTGVSLQWRVGGKKHQYTFSEVTDVHVYVLSDKEIDDYIATGEPMDKAGAYAIQGKFAPYIRKIDGEYNTVVGFPIGRVYQELKQNNLY